MTDTTGPVSKGLGRVTAVMSNPRFTIWAAILNVEVLLLFVYYSVMPASPTNLVQLAYPWIWINASIWAATRVDFAPTNIRTRSLAIAIGLGYFLVLAYFGGLYQFAGQGTGFRIAWAPPGWGPVPFYATESFTLALLPFKVVGFIALSYLVSVTVVDAAASGLAGFVGLFSCVSCTWPLLATVFTGIFGSASAAASVISNEPYGASTVVFLASIGLLVWRPTR